MTSNVIVTRESTSLISRSVLAAFCLAAGLAYRVSVSLIPTGILEDSFLLGFAALLLIAAVLARKSESLRRYWEIPFAFFIFTLAGFLGDVSISPLQQWFVHDVLHETPNVHNPLASTVLGTVLAQLFATFSLVLPIILLTMASGNDLSALFINRVKSWRWLVVGIIGFLIFFLLAAFGLSKSFFPNNGVTLSRFLALTPALLILVLCNGLREELWFRGLFLKKYGKFLGPLSSNVLAAIVFASFHVQVQYSRSLPIFLAIALIQGLVLGYLMQKSRSMLVPVIFHAGTDIPIFLVYLSYALR
ncbi:MAG TPA: CPBP family intramembrane glutamic endopeptidase [Ktedonobacteraceae bacterium]|nr:CPBP family intramembrane glutamic endopeptidase [Ktedonobacteraceae bacterium]